MLFKSVALVLSLGASSLVMGTLYGMEKIEEETRPLSRTKFFLNPFPNYFGKNQEKVLLNINATLQSLLKRIEVLHKDEEKDTLVTDRFFEKINALVEREAPGAKAYIAGGDGSKPSWVYL